MAIAFGGDLGSAGTTAGDPSTSASLTTSAAASSGSKIILVVTGFYDSGTESVSASGGGLSWNLDYTLVGAAPFQAYRVWLISADAPAGLASSTAITVSLGGNYFSRGIAAAYYTGLATSSYTDGSGSVSLNQPSLGWTTSAINTTNADDLLVCGYNADEAGVWSNTPGSSFNEITDADLSYWHIGAMYRIVSSTGSYSASGTATGDCNFIALVAAYKGAVDSVTGVENRFTIRHSRMTSW